MLCSKCSKILTASSERVDENAKPYFRHYESLAALRAIAEAGCQLCLMLLDQVPEVVSQRLDHSLFREDAQVVPESRTAEDSCVKYTIDDLQSDRGTYVLNVRFEIDMETVFARVYFIRCEGKRFIITEDW
jgi:hypothetical protein